MGGAVHQLMNAFLAAVFAIGIMLASHLYMEHRSSRDATIMATASLFRPLGR